MSATQPNIPKEASGLFLKLGSKTLLALVTGLFIADLFIPDALPFVDEIVLGILAVLLARWQSRRSAPAPAPAEKPGEKNVTPG